MSLSPGEAADTLRDIATVEAYSRRVYGYRQASPQLILWGVLWAAGYGLTAAWPMHGGTIWIVIVTIGLAAGFLIAVRGAPAVADPQRASPRLYWRFPGIALTAFAFIAATLAVMAPVTGRQVDAFIPLVVAASYTVFGLWLGARFIAAGVAIALLTLAGFFLLPAYFELWMAAIGGGALILAGLWLRRA